MNPSVLETKITQLIEIRGSYSCDHRGYFLNAFRAHDQKFLNSWGHRAVQQVNISRTEVVGSVRGLHLQASPHSEAKLVRCIRGRVWDVAVDLRLDSCSYAQWHAVELSAEAGNSLLIPEGCAHGYQVLEPGSELLYLHSGGWIPEAETGIRFDDPLLSIDWPLKPLRLSDRDLALPMLNLKS